MVDEVKVIKEFTEKIVREEARKVLDELKKESAQETSPNKAEDLLTRIGLGWGVTVNLPLIVGGIALNIIPLILGDFYRGIMKKLLK